jgi:hypothetical protein
MSEGNGLIIYLAIVIIIFIVLQPVRTKYKLERFKPLLIIPVIIIGLFEKGASKTNSLFVYFVAITLVIYAVWQTIKNFKTN